MHKPYIHARKDKLRWSKDFKCFVVANRDEHYLCYPSNFYLGERWVYMTPGIDTHAANFRGNLSDDWPCVDFGKDLQGALDWLHKAEEPQERTQELWLKQTD